MKEKTADKMFEKLGYKKSEDKHNINYIKMYSFINGNRVREQIRFCKLDKYVHIESFNYDTGVIFGKFLDMGELQAINKKVEELRMARVKKIIQTIKLHKFKTEVNKKIIEEMDESSYLVWYRDGTCKEVNFKDDLIDILSKDHIKPIRYIFNMSDRIIVDRKIYINTEEVF